MLCSGFCRFLGGVGGLFRKVPGIWRGLEPLAAEALKPAGAVLVLFLDVVIGVLDDLGFAISTSANTRQTNPPVASPTSKSVFLVFHTSERKITIHTFPWLCHQRSKGSDTDPWDTGHSWKADRAGRSFEQLGLCLSCS